MIWQVIPKANSCIADGTTYSVIKKNKTSSETRWLPDI